MSISNKFYVSRKVILDMLEDRGWDTSNYRNYTNTEIDIMIKNMSVKTKDISTLDILIEKDTKKILVKYILTSKVRSLNIKNLTETFIEETLNEGDELILIIMDRLTNDLPLETFFNNIYTSKKIFCQYFWIKKLTFNVTEHEIVPKHIILSNEEKENLLKQYNITDITKINFIKQNDAVAKYYGMKKDDVCKIIRKSETAGLYTNYRLCVY